MEGKTLGKDIMLLCKGWYNKEKYKTTKDALITYYHKEYGCEDIDPDFNFINVVLLQPAISEFLNDNTKDQFISYIFTDSIIDVCELWDKYNKKKLSYDEELYYRLTHFIRRLKTRYYDEVLIDTDQYFTINNEDQRILVEPIIE